MALPPVKFSGKKSPADLKGYGNTGKAKPKPADRAAGWGPGWEWISESSGPQGEGFLSGTDYLFFQGPTPRTGQQKDMPDFFSAENFKDFKVTPFWAAATATGLASFVVLFATVWAAPGTKFPWGGEACATVVCKAPAKK